MGLNLLSPKICARLLLILAALLLTACGPDEDESSCSFLSRECTEDESGEVLVTACGSNDIGLVDGCGEQISAVDIQDPVIINLQGLANNQQHSITIADSNGDDISLLAGYSAGSSGLTSDKDGNIYMSTIVQSMPNTAATGDYLITVFDSTPAAVETLNYVVEDRNRVFCADGVDPDGAVAKSSFESGDNVFAIITGTLGDGGYDIYVIADNQTAIPDSGLISGTAIPVTLTAGTGGINLGSFTEGSYDVLVDVNGDGIYNRDSDLMSRHARLHPCFAIQASNSGSAVTAQIAADRNANKREIFDPDADKEAVRDVFANLIPGEVSSDTMPGTADVYLVVHQDTWNDSDPLNDVSGGTPPELNNSPVQNGTNVQGNTLQWSYSQLDAGCYDIVIDTNRDGVYTVGTDFLDNTNHLGDSTDCGFRVSTSDSTNVTINSHEDNEVTTATAVEITGMVTVPSGTLESAFLRITSGAQTNIISMDALTSAGGGNYSVPVPLFSGNNLITVSAIFSDNTSMSETILLRSVTDLALFRAQMTWDGSTDMDLHLVRPDGDYSNGGGGDGDCNYANCKVGLDGEGTNSIDWGISGVEDDDPKLDVDCISCGNGIENIWMNEINDDGTYRVYVDAFSGDEDDSDVIVTISILGSTVGQVNCGNMDSGSSTDTCYVGDINWRGGSNGSGSFTLVGTLSSDF